MTAVFFAFVFVVLILFAPPAASFLDLEVFFLLPLSPLFVVWLYFLFRAIVPLTGGMPGTGFKKWFYGYLLLLLVFLYTVALTVVLNFLFPLGDKDYTERIFPPAIMVFTLFVVFRIPRINKFLWKVFGSDQKAEAEA